MTSRRKFIATAAAAAGTAGLAAGYLRWPHLQSTPPEHPHATALDSTSFPNPLLLPGNEGLFGMMDATAPFTIVARPASLPSAPGGPAPRLVFEVEQGGRRHLNPVLVTRRGASFRAHFWNALDETSIVHWHGLIVDSNNDGHPHYAVGAGETFDYQFTVANRASTYWYHPHPHHLAARQTYLGLAGFFIIEDEDEMRLRQALDLRFGSTDIPLLIQDKRVDSGGRLVYGPTPADRFTGYFGTEMLVNLTQRAHFDAATRLYRFRLLNGSNARIYRLAFTTDGKPLPMRVIGADGGLLDRARDAREIFLCPAERADVLLDLRDARPGDSVMLRSLPFDAMHRIAGVRPADAPSSAHDGHGAHARRATADAPHTGAVQPDGSAVELLQIRVTRKAHYALSVPASLSGLTAADPGEAAARTFTLDHASGAWRINGGSYRMTETAFTVRRGEKEIWAFHNTTASMPHPMHVHGFQFRVVAREGGPPHAQPSAPASGLPPTELGWKDTVLVWPGETVKVLIDFSHPFYTDQVYMVQCHNAEHEDQGMMLNFRITG